MAVIISAGAQRLRLPYPPLLAVGGAAVAFFPWAPELRLDPDLALALFIAPVLLDAAYDSSPRDLKRNALPIAFLTLAAVGVTVVAVAFAARWLRPDLPWAAAIALGAIVAPPDAAAATSVLKATPVPQRLRTILEGESLFNDASSLLIYRFAVAAVGGGLAWGWPLVATMAWTLLGSLAFGVVAAALLSRVTSRVREAPTAILLQFIGAFGVWITAEKIGVSPIIAIVVFGMVAARVSARRVEATVRAPSYAVWETVVFGLNAVAFALVGLQVGPLWRELSAGEQERYAVFALAILAVVVIARLVWVMTYHSFVQAKNRWFGAVLPTGEQSPEAQHGLIVAWAGMRGLVSLAAAYALPAAFPNRDLIQLSAFVVVMGTLVVQGLTLGPLVRLMKIRDDDILPGEIRTARRAIAEAAIADLAPRRSAAAKRLRADYAERLAHVTGETQGDGRAELEIDRLTAEVLVAKRDALSRLRADGEISDMAYFQIEEELDRHDLALTPVVR
ncbi:MAG: sodium:proton antiporter [Brevundimonas sp.]|nr:MAG: sodium:proton antiporter [Brevundimonas sp.]